MKKIVLIFSLLYSNFLFANDIIVLGLFKNKAIVKINGKQHTLITNKKIVEGITLISSDSDVAVIDVFGEVQEFKLGHHVRSKFKKRKFAEAKIPPLKGMYKVKGYINGLAVDFLVDTGATWVVMNMLRAKSLGLDYRSLGKRTRVNTANGITFAYVFTLNKVRVGEIELRNVEVGVLESNSPTMVLLGNSFLNRLEMTRQGQVMLLKQKF